MNADKIRNLTDIELTHQERDLADQLFSLKFQLTMGQTESLKKIRQLKKDIARVKTVMRQKQIAAGNGTPAPEAAAPRRLSATATAAPARPKVKKASAPAKTAKKKPASKKAATEKK